MSALLVGFFLAIIFEVSKDNTLSRPYAMEVGVLLVGHSH